MYRSIKHILASWLLILQTLLSCNPQLMQPEQAIQGDAMTPSVAGNPNSSTEEQLGRYTHRPQEEPIHQVNNTDLQALVPIEPGSTPCYHTENTQPPTKPIDCSQELLVDTNLLAKQANSPCFTTREGHQIYFKDERCEKAVIKLNTPPSFSRTCAVIVKKKDPHMPLHHLSCQTKAWQDCNLHLVLPEKTPDQQGILYIGNDYIGLLGGMKKGGKEEERGACGHTRKTCAKPGQQGHVGYVPPKESNQKNPSPQPPTPRKSTRNEPTEQAFQQISDNLFSLANPFYQVYQLFNYLSTSSSNSDRDLATIKERVAREAAEENARFYADLKRISQEVRLLTAQQEAARKAKKAQQKAQDLADKAKFAKERLDNMVASRSFFEQNTIQRSIPIDVCENPLSWLEGELGLFDFVKEELSDQLEYYPAEQHKQIIIASSKETLHRVKRIRTKLERLQLHRPYFLARPLENLYHVTGTQRLTFFDPEDEKEIADIVTFLAAEEKRVQKDLEALGEDMASHLPPERQSLPPRQESPQEQAMYRSLELGLHRVEDIGLLAEKTLSQIASLQERIQATNLRSPELSILQKDIDQFLDQNKKNCSYLLNKQQGILEVYAKTPDCITLPLQEGLEKYEYIEKTLQVIEAKAFKMLGKAYKHIKRPIDYKTYTVTPYTANAECLRLFYNKLCRELQPASAIIKWLSPTPLPQTREAWASLGLSQPFLDLLNKYRYPLANYFEQYVKWQPDVEAQIKNFLVYQLELRDAPLSSPPLQPSLPTTAGHPIALAAHVNAYLKEAQQLDQETRQEQAIYLLKEVERLKKEHKNDYRAVQHLLLTDELTFEGAQLLTQKSAQHQEYLKQLRSLRRQVKQASNLDHETLLACGLRLRPRNNLTEEGTDSSDEEALFSRSGLALRKGAMQGIGNALKNAPEAWLMGFTGLITSPTTTIESIVEFLFNLPELHQQILDFLADIEGNEEEKAAVVAEYVAGYALSCANPVFRIKKLAGLYNLEKALGELGAHKHRKGGGKNAPHANEKKKQVAANQLEEVKAQYEALKSMPNKTPEINEELEKLKKQRDHLQKRKDNKGETHSRNDKGNRNK